MNMKQTLLLAHHTMDALAREIEAVSEGRIEYVPIEWNHFKDGMPDLVIPASKVRNNNVAFLASFNKPADILEQLGVIYAIPRYRARSFKLVLPYFPGTMERVEEEGQIATARTLARLLEVIPTTKSGPTEVVFYDIHALGIRFYFGDGIIPVLESAMRAFKRQMSVLGQERIAIAFPDEGAYKRFKRLFEGYELIICEKRREGEKRIIVIKEGDPKNRNVWIVDDLVETGGTLIECKDALVARGSESVSVFSPHWVTPNESWKKFINAGFAHAWMSDSCPATAAATEGKCPFGVVSLAPSISSVILEEEDYEL
jgi:phosphoribosylpyrophosphate synthetase